MHLEFEDGPTTRQEGRSSPLLSGSFGIARRASGRLGRGLLVFWGLCQGLLGASWGHLGTSWGPLGAESLKCPLGRSLWAPSWGRPGALLGRLGDLLGSPGALLGCLGALLGRLGTILGASRAVLDALEAEEANLI